MAEKSGQVSWLSRQRRPQLGSNLGPLAAEYREKHDANTQNKPKRDNRLVNRLLVRDQGSEVQILSPRPSSDDTGLQPTQWPLTLQIWTLVSILVNGSELWVGVG